MTLLDLLPFVAIAAIMWLLMVRPAQKRQREQARMISALKPGVKVMTASGMLGTVTSVGDEVCLEVAPGVIVEFVPQAIARVIPAPATTIDPEALRMAPAEPVAEVTADASAVAPDPEVAPLDPVSGLEPNTRS